MASRTTRACPCYCFQLMSSYLRPHSILPAHWPLSVPWPHEIQAHYQNFTPADPPPWKILPPVDLQSSSLSLNGTASADPSLVLSKGKHPTTSHKHTHSAVLSPSSHSVFPFAYHHLSSACEPAQFFLNGHFLS